MKLNDKTLNFLNSKCIEKFGCTFDQMYHMIDENEKLKQENKRKEKEIKKLKKR